MYIYMKAPRKRGLTALAAAPPKAKEAKLHRGPTRIVLLCNLVGADEVAMETDAVS